MPSLILPGIQGLTADTTSPDQARRRTNNTGRRRRPVAGLVRDQVYLSTAVFRDAAANDFTGNGSVTIPGTVQPGDWGIVALTSAATIAVSAIPVPAGWVGLYAQTDMGTGSRLLAARQFQSGDTAVTITQSGAARIAVAASWYANSGGFGPLGAVTSRGGAQATTTAAGPNLDPRELAVVVFHEKATASPAVSVTPGTLQRAARFTNGTSLPSVYLGEYGYDPTGGPATRTGTYGVTSANGSGVQIAVMEVQPAQLIAARRPTRAAPRTRHSNYVQVVPTAAAAPANPAKTFDACRARTRTVLLRKTSRLATLPPADQGTQPGNTKRPRPRLAALRRGRAVTPTPAPAAPAAPAWIPQTGHRAPPRAPTRRNRALIGPSAPDTARTPQNVARRPPKTVQTRRRAPEGPPKATQGPPNPLIGPRKRVRVAFIRRGNPVDVIPAPAPIITRPIDVTHRPRTAAPYRTRPRRAQMPPLTLATAPGETHGRRTGQLPLLVRRVRRVLRWVLQPTIARPPGTVQGTTTTGTLAAAGSSSSIDTATAAAGLLDAATGVTGPDSVTRSSGTVE